MTKIRRPRRREGRKLASDAVVDPLEPVVVPFELPGARIGDCRRAAEADLAVCRCTLSVVNPGAHDQIDGPFDLAVQRDEVGDRVAGPRVVPAADQIDRNVLIAVGVIEDVVLLPKVVVDSVTQRLDEPVFIFGNVLKRSRSATQRQLEQIVAAGVFSSPRVHGRRRRDRAIGDSPSVR